MTQGDLGHFGHVPGKVRYLNALRVCVVSVEWPGNEIKGLAVVIQKYNKPSTTPP